MMDYQTYQMLSAEDEATYLQALAEQPGYWILRYKAQEGLTPDFSLRGKELEVDLLVMAAMREGIERVFAWVEHAMAEEETY